jgi:type IV secretory pathway VirB2 component (pilin)
VNTKTNSLRPWWRARSAVLVTSLLSLAFLSMGEDALAQAPGSIGRIETKLQGLEQFLQRLGIIGVGIGVLVVGVKFLSGDPHAWRYAMLTVLGASIIFGSAEVVTWLQN